MILKNNSEDVKVLVRYFESLSIENRLKLSIIVIQRCFYISKDYGDG